MIFSILATAFALIQSSQYGQDIGKSTYNDFDSLKSESKFSSCFAFDPITSSILDKSYIKSRMCRLESSGSQWNIIFRYYNDTLYHVISIESVPEQYSPIVYRQQISRMVKKYVDGYYTNGVYDIKDNDTGVEVSSKCNNGVCDIAIQEFSISTVDLVMDSIMNR